MLQKPSKSSKARDHAKYLLARLDKWKAGDIKGILNECKAIQKRISASNKHSLLSNRKAFCRLMLAGKLRQALKFINNNNLIKGVHTTTDQVKHLLQDKHPSAQPAQPESLLPVSDSNVQTVIFEDISYKLFWRIV